MDVIHKKTGFLGRNPVFTLLRAGSLLAGDHPAAGVVLEADVAVVVGRGGGGQQDHLASGAEQRLRAGLQAIAGGGNGGRGGRRTW